jgi:hypothetical protein
MADPIVITDGHAIAHFIRDYWPMILGVGGLIVSILIVIKGKIPYLENQVKDVSISLKKMEDSRFVSENVLFDKDNQFKFQTLPMCMTVREECHNQQRVFQDNFCRKLDTITLELKAIVNDADLKREETRHEITAMNKQLIELMTQMKTILARDRREETAEMVQLVVRQVMVQMTTSGGSPASRYLKK